MPSLMQRMRNALWRETGKTRDAGTPDGTKKSAVGGLISLHTQGRPVWTPRDYETLSREGYVRNAVAYRCVRMIAEAAAL